jgi:hypothetical protein
MSFCFAGLALTVGAQSQPPDPNPNPNEPVVIPPETAAQPQPDVQPQPAADTWDHFWGIQKLPEDDDWTRHFRVGGLVGLNISANFNLKNPSTLGANNAANGIYDDGYVRKDDTGNAQGYTSYWGYDNSSQLSGSQLTMHSTTSYDVNNSTKESGSAFVGFDMAYGGNLWAWGNARIGWDLGFGLLPIYFTDSHAITGVSVNQTVYQFDTGGIVVPGAPYQGGPSGLGPTILSAPTPGTPIIIPGGIITGSRTLDVTLYTVRLGPSVYWDLNEYFGFSAGAGPAVGIVNGNYNFDEVITAGGTSAINKGQINATDVVYGGYVNASLMYHMVPNGDLYVGVQYMSLGNATIGGGGQEGQLNLGGQIYLSAGINWPF